MKQRGNAAVTVLATVVTLIIIGVIIVGGYQLGWWLRGNAVNRNAKINRTSYEVQQTYVEKSLDDIALVRSIDAQIADPADKSDIPQLRAQRIATVTEACDAIGRLTSSGAGPQPDIQAFHDSECTP